MRRLSLTVAFIVLLVLGMTSPDGVSAQGRSPKPKPTPAATTPVNLNTATLAELQALPGVGAATAKLILEHRQKNGGFKKIEELMNIKGIGEKSFLKLKPMVTVTPDKADRQDTQGKGL
jgi:competence protein ComEA